MTALGSGVGRNREGVKNVEPEERRSPSRSVFGCRLTMPTPHDQNPAHSQQGRCVFDHHLKRSYRPRRDHIKRLATCSPFLYARMNDLGILKATRPDGACDKRRPRLAALDQANPS
jgi:hypothetical protein